MEVRPAAADVRTRFCGIGIAFVAGMCVGLALQSGLLELVSWKPTVVSGDSKFYRTETVTMVTTLKEPTGENCVTVATAPEPPPPTKETVGVVEDAV